MALYEQVPYTNFHGVNLAWILANVKDFDERLDTDETRLSAAESSIPVRPEDWKDGMKFVLAEEEG